MNEFRMALIDPSSTSKASRRGRLVTLEYPNGDTETMQVHGQQLIVACGEQLQPEFSVCPRMLTKLTTHLNLSARGDLVHVEDFARGINASPAEIQAIRFLATMIYAADSEYLVCDMSHGRPMVDIMVRWRDPNREISLRLRRARKPEPVRAIESAISGTMAYSN